MDVLAYQLCDLVQNFSTCSLGAAATASTSAGQFKSSTTPTDAETRQKQDVIRNSPAVKFLTRTDFFSLVQYSDVSAFCSSLSIC